MNRSRLPYLIAVAWISTMALAFFAGKGSAPVDLPAGDEGAPAAARPKTADPGRPASPERGWSGSADTRITVSSSSGPRGGKAPSAPASFTPVSVDAATAARVLSDPDPLRRMVGLTEMLQGITPENAKEMLAAFRDNPGGDMMGRMQDFGLFLEAWARVDGPAAIEWVVNSGELASFQSSGGGWGGPGGRDRGGPGGEWAERMSAYRVLSSWASADPEAARAWAEAKGEEGKENPYMLGVVRGISRTDLAAATALTEKMPYGRLRGMAADGLIETALLEGPEASLGWVRGLQDAQLRDGITARLADRLARTDPMLAITAVSDIQDPERKKETITGVASSWARRDPAEAMNWVSRMDDAATKAAAQASVVSSWARRDEAAAAAWLGAQPRGESLDASINAFVHRTAGSNPQQALLTANAITNEQTRRATLERIMNQWMQTDPEAAKKFLEKAP